MYRNVPSRTKNNQHIDNRIVDECFSLPSAKCIFINVYKNASSSIQSWLGNQGGVGPISYFTIPDKETYTKFWVLRNPVTRVVSSFFEIIKYIEEGHFKEREMDEEELQETIGWESSNLDIKEKFNGFLDSLDNSNFYDSHLYPQILFLQDKKLEVKEVTTLLFNNLQQELLDLCKNKSFTKFPHYTTHGGSRLFDGHMHYIPSDITATFIPSTFSLLYDCNRWTKSNYFMPSPPQIEKYDYKVLPRLNSVDMEASLKLEERRKKNNQPTWNGRGAYARRLKLYHTKELLEEVTENKGIQDKIRKIYREDWELYTEVKNSRTRF